MNFFFTNKRYFRGNLAVVDGGIVLIGLLLTPTALLAMGGVGASWALFLSKNKDPNWRTVVKGKEITPMQRNHLLEKLETNALYQFL